MPTLPPVVAMVVFGIPAALLQHKHMAINRDFHAQRHIDWARIVIVGLILVAAIVTNVTVNIKFSAIADISPSSASPSGWLCSLAVPCASLTGSLIPDRLQGLAVSAGSGDLRFDDAGRKAAGGIVADRLRSWLHFRRVRQHSANRPGPEAGWLRLGLPRLRGWLRRFHALVRFLGRRSARRTCIPEAKSVGRGCATAGTSPSAYVVGFLALV